MKPTLAFVLAGGRGSRLFPLTAHRAKPAVPIGGRYRIIDFVITNLLNGGYNRVYVLTQYMSTSVIRHLEHTWTGDGVGAFVEVVPAQMQLHDHWYRGTADSVLQNLHLLRESGDQDVAIFGGDHVYLMDIEQMEQVHRDSGAVLTIAAKPVPIAEARDFGVLQVDATGRITAFVEKATDPPPMPGRPDSCLASMGIYFFHAATLDHALVQLSREIAELDFGKHVIPYLLDQGLHLQAYDYGTNTLPGWDEPNPYWRDVGTIDAYFDVNMELREPLPPLDLYNRRWPVRSSRQDLPPARFVRTRDSSCQVVDSLVCEGAIVSGASLHSTLVGHDSYVHAGARLERVVVLDGVDIGSGAQLRNLILDKNCSVEPGTCIGFDPDRDAQHYPFRSERGVIVLPKGSRLRRDGTLELAADIVPLLRRDPATARALDAFSGSIVVSERFAHEPPGTGPRFRSFDRALA